MSHRLGGAAVALVTVAACGGHAADDGSMATSDASTQAADAALADVVPGSSTDASAVEANPDLEAAAPDALGADALEVVDSGSSPNGDGATDAAEELDAEYFSDVWIPPPYGLPPGH